MVLGRRSLHLGACLGSSFAAERPRTVPILYARPIPRLDSKECKAEPGSCLNFVRSLAVGRIGSAHEQCAVEPRVLPTVAVQGRRAKKAEAREGAPEAPVVDRG